MLNPAWSEYDNDTLSFVFNESRTLQNETFVSLRESINKSFGALAIIGSLIAYCINKMIEVESSIEAIPYTVGVVGLGVCIYFIWENLMPTKMNISGTTPETLLNDYFGHEDYKSDRKREMLIVRLKDMNSAIYANITEVTNRSRRFRYAALTFLVTAALSLVVACLC